MEENGYSDDSSHREGKYDDDEHYDSDEEEGGVMIPEHAFMAKSLASRSLAYDPFKPFNPRLGMKHGSSTKDASSGGMNKRKRGDEGLSHDGEVSKEAVELILKGLANKRNGGGKLKDLLQAAALDYSGSNL